MRILSVFLLIFTFAVDTNFAEHCTDPLEHDARVPACDSQGHYVTLQCDNENIAVGRPAYQVETDNRYNAEAERAVDGNPKPHFLDEDTCSRTKARLDPWFVVDLGSELEVSTVAIVNKEDANNNAGRVLVIGATNAFDPVQAKMVAGKDFEICTNSTEPIPKGKKQPFRCEMKGRYVVVQLQSKNPLELILCEVEVYRGLGPNIAKGKKTYQIDTDRREKQATADKAVDGDPNPDMAGGSCTFTSPKLNPWWVVDLGHHEFVAKVAISNRGDCCADRLGSLHIGVTDAFDKSATKLDSGKDYDVCATQSSGFKAGSKKYFDCQKRGRYVVIQLQGRENLALCEVEVYAGLNLALRRLAGQIDVDPRYVKEGKPSKAVDGDANADFFLGKSCTHTSQRENPWWAVDLGSVQAVRMVVVKNRGDCCHSRLHSLNIGLSNSFKSRSELLPDQDYHVCATSDGAVAGGPSTPFECHGNGRYVIVQIMAKEYLTLCEVEVFGATGSECWCVSPHGVEIHDSRTKGQNTHC